MKVISSGLGGDWKKLLMFLLHGGVSGRVDRLRFGHCKDTGSRTGVVRIPACQERRTNAFALATSPARSSSLDLICGASTSRKVSIPPLSATCVDVTR